MNKQGEALKDIVAAKGVTEAVWQKWVLPAYPTDLRAKPALTTSKDPTQP